MGMPKYSVEERFKLYRKTGITEMRPYELDEDLSGVSVNQEDNPKIGDMIARNSLNHADKWLVDEKYFHDNYEEFVKGE
jgi:hypothetical protein